MLLSKETNEDLYFHCKTNKQKNGVKYYLSLQVRQDHRSFHYNNACPQVISYNVMSRSVLLFVSVTFSPALPQTAFLH